MNASASDFGRLEEATRQLEEALVRLEVAFGRRRARFEEAPQLASEIGVHVEAALAEIENILAGKP